MLTIPDKDNIQITFLFSNGFYSTPMLTAASLGEGARK